MSMLGKIDKTTWVVNISDNDKSNGFIDDDNMIIMMVLMMMTVATILLIKVKIAVMVLV